MTFARKFKLNNVSAVQTIREMTEICLQKVCFWAIPRYGHYIQRANCWKKIFFYILLLSSFCVKFEQIFVIWYLIVNIKETSILFTKAVNIFVLKNQPSILHVQVDSAIPLNQHVRHKFYNNNKNMTAS